MNVAGDVTNSVLVSGDDATIELRVDGDDALLGDRLTRRRLPRATPRPLPLHGVQASAHDHLDRVAEVGAVRGAVAAGRTFEIGGAAGIGKSYVVRAALADDTVMPDGSVYVDAAGKRLPDLLQELHEAFFESQSPVLADDEEIRGALARCQAVVVVDAIDLADHERRALAAMLPACHVVLVASERVLNGVDGLDVRGLQPADALVLVEQELGRAATGGERATASQVCSLLGGHPLELRQAAACVREGERSFAQLAAALARSAASDPARARSGGGLAASAALTELLLRSLSPDEAEIVAELAVLRGAPVGAEHLAELTGVADVRSTLHGLEARRLVACDEGGRYRVAGALSDLRESDPQAVVATTAHFVRWARGQLPETVLAEAPALLALLHRAADEGRDADAIAIGRASLAAFAWGRRWGTWKDGLDVVLDAAQRSGDSGACAWALHQLGTLAYCAGNTRAAIAALGEALRIRRRLGEQDAIAATRHNLDLIHGPAATPGRPAVLPSASIFDESWLSLLVGFVFALAVLGGAFAFGLSGGNKASGTPVATTPSPLVAPQQTGTVTAPRVRVTLVVSTAGDGNGTIRLLDGTHDCANDCSFDFDLGTKVTLVASPAAGSAFIGWTAPCDNPRTCRITMSRTRTLTALFAVKTTATTPTTTTTECDDGIDNDGDGLIDHDDPDCLDGTSESPAVTTPPPATTVPLPVVPPPAVVVPPPPPPVVVAPPPPPPPPAEPLPPPVDTSPPPP